MFKDAITDLHCVHKKGLNSMKGFQYYKYSSWAHLELTWANSFLFYVSLQYTKKVHVQGWTILTLKHGLN